MAVEPLRRYRCSECGYGASCRTTPERCPMCAGSIWDLEEPRDMRELLSDLNQRLVQADHIAWMCACGQSYRLDSVSNEVRFWPRGGDGISVDAYCRRGLPPGTRCIKCDATLRLSR